MTRWSRGPSTISRVKGQAEDGSFSSQAGVGPTGLVVAAVLEHGRSVSDPVVAKALKYIESIVQADGGIYTPNSGPRELRNLHLRRGRFTEANKDGRYDKTLADAEAFLTSEQWDGGEKVNVEKDNLAFGGAGYGKQQAARPVEHAASCSTRCTPPAAAPDDEAIKRALVFVSRCQNLEIGTQHHALRRRRTPTAASTTRRPAAARARPATPTAGGLRSYGSMTYAGLKSMIYAGVEGRRPARQGGRVVAGQALRR